MLNKDLTIHVLHRLINIDNNDVVISNMNHNNHHDDSSRSDHQANRHHHSFQFGFNHRILVFTRLLCTITSRLYTNHYNQYRSFLIHCSNIPALATLIPGENDFYWTSIKSLIASLLCRNTGGGNDNDYYSPLVGLWLYQSTCIYYSSL